MLTLCPSTVVATAEWSRSPRGASGRLRFSVQEFARRLDVDFSGIRLAVATTEDVPVSRAVAAKIAQADQFRAGRRRARRSLIAVVRRGPLAALRRRRHPC